MIKFNSHNHYDNCLGCRAIRAEALEEAARLCDKAAAANIGGESMDDGWRAKMWGALTLQAERLSDHILALRAPAAGVAGQPSRDAKVTK